MPQPLDQGQQGLKFLRRETQEAGQMTTAHSFSSSSKTEVLRGRQVQSAGLTQLRRQSS